MFGPAARTVYLVVAAWALLFAPGAAQDDIGAADPVNADRVAAAMIAPTFGSDALLADRTCRLGADRDPDGCQDAAATLAAAAVAVFVAGIAALRRRQPRRHDLPVRDRRSARAPPRD